MIAIPNFNPKDGLYQIDKGRIHKYKGKGGTVRVYDLIEIDDTVWENEKYKLIRMTEERRVNKMLAEKGCNFAVYGICKDGDCKRCPFEPKRGKWIDHKEIIHTDPEIWGYSQECSLCGFTLGAKEYNYCPNCGAKMERRADEHNT